MIRFEGVRRSYGLNVAVKGLDLEVPPGELFAMLGHNGAGKTTTIKMMVGLLRPERGSVFVGGHEVADAARESAQLIGYVPDQPYLYDKLSGREFLAFVGEMHGLTISETSDRIEREIERFGLSGFVDELTESYSHGMKQRTVFASAMLHDPQTLIVDEPLVGLDPHSIRLVKDLLRSEADRGASVFMSTHTLAAAEEIADRIGVMNRGELIFLGSVDELRRDTGGEDQTLEALYLSMLEGRRHEPGHAGSASDGGAA